MKETFTSSSFTGLAGQVQEFMENYGADWPEITVVTTKNPEGWQAVLTPKTGEEAITDILCNKYGVIRHFWGREDIRDIQTLTRDLTEPEIDAIKTAIEERVATGDISMSFESIEDIAMELFPDAFEDGEEEDESDDFREIYNL